MKQYLIDLETIFEADTLPFKNDKNHQVVPHGELKYLYWTYVARFYYKVVAGFYWRQVNQDFKPTRPSSKRLNAKPVDSSTDEVS